MDDAGPLRHGRLRRADVEPAIDLARVGRDDLDRAAKLVAQRERETDREAGLAGRGRPADDDERRRPASGPDRRLVGGLGACLVARGLAQARAPRSAYGPA